MAEIREYYLTQMHKVREHYEQQRDLILEFSINRIGHTGGGDDPAARPSCANTTDVLVKIENGAAPTSVPAEDQEIYQYNDNMKNEIQKLTSLRNLQDAFTEPDRDHHGFNVSVGGSGGGDRPTTSFEAIGEAVSNGKLRTSEDEGDEKTSMLRNTR